MPPLSLTDFAKKHNLEIADMTIDHVVSPFPRVIHLPQCPKCENYLFLYHPIDKRDPFIAAKVTEGILKDEVGEVEKWLMSCWTADCDFYLPIDQDDLAECPECNKKYSDLYTLYDHMRYQCTKEAADRDTIIKAGAGEYLQELSIQ